MEDAAARANASLLLRLSALGVKDGDLATVREALLKQEELMISSKVKRNSNLEGTPTTPHAFTRVERSTPRYSPGTLHGADTVNDDLMTFFKREFSRRSVINPFETGTRVDEIDDELEPELSEATVRKIDSWFDFDIFDFAREMESEGGALVKMGEMLFVRHGFSRKYMIPSNVLRDFLIELQANYLNLPYHNAIHAADVAQSMSHFIIKCGLNTKGDDLVRFAAITSALGHDVGHVGYSNRYLIETRAPLALMYNDKSPLEMMHASKMFTVMWARLDGKCDITANMDRVKDIPRFRKLCIEMILATDNAQHEKVLDKAQSEDDESVFKAAMHAADLGGGAKTVSLAHEWASRVVQEFFRQGDAERALGLYPVLPVMDRHNSMPKSVFQEAFIRQICLPVYSTLNAIPGLDFSVQVRSLEAMARHWVGDTSQTLPSKLKETRSFSLQKKQSESRSSEIMSVRPYTSSARDRRTTVESRDDDEDEDSGIDSYEDISSEYSRGENGVKILKSKSLDEPLLGRRDVRHRLNLSPRAFLSDSDSMNPAQPSTAVRTAVLRSRSRNSSPVQGNGTLPLAPTSSARVIADAKQSIKKMTLRESQEIDDSFESRRRKVRQVTSATKKS